jgi:hypothetical protein
MVLNFIRLFGRTVPPQALNQMKNKRKLKINIIVHKGNNKITELRTILQRESQNS